MNKVKKREKIEAKEKKRAREKVANEVLLSYLREIHTASLQLVSNPSTKHVDKKLSKWAAKVSAKAEVTAHLLNLQYDLR